MSALADRHRLTRRQLLAGAGGVAALAAGGAGVAELFSHPRRVPRIRSFAVRPGGLVRAFSSRPDLRPPTVTATATAGIKAGPTPNLLGSGDPPGFLFLGPGPVSLQGSQQYGPLIVDRRGEPVWFRPLPDGLQATNFGPALYNGQPVLAWWEGKIKTTGYGQGEAVIVDTSYREIARVRAANGRSMDLHALTLTPHGTALFTCHPDFARADLGPIGGPRHGYVLDPIIQEVDIATGRLIWEWRGLTHVPLTDSYQQRHDDLLDYMHPNSINATPDGNLLVSSRHTWALYKLDRRTGNVIWTLGGKHSDFRIAREAQFSWQHDAEQLSGRLFTVFDNGSNGAIKTESASRGLLLEVDESHKTVTLRKAYTSPKPLLATSMGSVQVLPSGRVIVGWGTASHTSEFAPDGALLFDAGLPAGLYSFRGLWLDWDSAPRYPPAIAAGRDTRSGAGLVYATWNGATEVTDWRVDAGPSRGNLQTVGIAEHRGFETVIPLLHRHRYASVTALDSHGQSLGSSQVTRL